MKQILSYKNITNNSELLAAVETFLDVLYSYELHQGFSTTVPWHTIVQWEIIQFHLISLKNFCEN